MRPFCETRVILESIFLQITQEMTLRSDFKAGIFTHIFLFLLTSNKLIYIPTFNSNSDLYFIVDQLEEIDKGRQHYTRFIYN